MPETLDLKNQSLASQNHKNVNPREGSLENPGPRTAEPENLARC